MKNLNIFLKLLLLPFFFILFSTFTYADDTNTDNFGSSLENWTGDISRVSYNSSRQMRITPDGTASKTFNFDSSYANATTTIAFDLSLNSEWEDSGGAQDYIDVYVNNVLVVTYSYPANYSGRQTITTGLANGSGDVPIRITTRNTANNEYAYVDNVSVTVHTPSVPTPIAEYRMDACSWDGSSSEVVDSAGSVSGTSFNGANTVSDHIVCNSGDFDGINDYVSMGDSFNNIFGNTNDTFTITAWIKPEALTGATSNHGTANTFIAKASDPSNDNLEIGITTGGNLHLYLDTSGGDTQANFGSGITIGSWHFIAVTYDGSDVSVTIDSSRTTDNRWSGNLDQANGSPFTIGTTRHSDTYFNGLVDEVKIFSTALSAAAINSIYANESAGNNYDGTSRTCQNCNVPPTITGIPDQAAVVGTPFIFSIASYATGSNIVYSATGLPPGLTIDASTGVISGTPTAVGTSTVTATVANADGTASDAFDIVVSTVAIVATNNVYTTTPATPVNGNFITDDTGAGVDSGTNILASITPASGPSQGSVVISPDGNFTYTPNTGVAGTDVFTYTITDSFGGTASATVTITIATSYTSGVNLPFHLVNSDNSRNLIGNYKIAGNTVLCLTEKTDGYGGTCHGANDYQTTTSNMHVVKYLDIDNDISTWNSTSSYIDVDTSYDATQGVVWAGLFWEGRIAVNDGNHPIRYWTENGTAAPTAVDIGYNSGVVIGNLDIKTTGATSIKLQINSGSYNDVQVAEFHEYESGGGQTYAAYANVTSIVKPAITASGKYTFTVANLTTMEGREASPGAFGGWSLVVIYAEDYQNAGSKPRNISIYNGFISIGTSDTPITISGFKLPSAGPIQAQLSVFSGEGEYLYGRTTTSNNEDWMKISDDITEPAANWDYMPGLTAGTHVGNRDNMFDARLDGILRDPIVNEFNDMATNNVGVDVDNYDVGSLMTGYRNNDADINEVYIQTYSDNDYITPSMMAFSAELYVPRLCYDYTLDIGGYVLASTNNEIITPFGGFGIPLTTTLYLRSLEGDIDLKDVNVNYTIGNTSQVQYTFNNCSTEISETGQYDYTDACPYTRNEVASGFSMYIGTGKTTSSGGIISANEDRYIKWESDFHRSDVDTDFTFSIDYSVNYGSGAVPLHQNFTAVDLCPPSNTGFLPQLGFFNVIDPDNGAANVWDRWSLYTQVARRAFDLTVYAYSADNLGLITSDLNLSVEVEMIRADNFSRDADTACNDQHSILSDVPAKFVHFNEGQSANINYEADDVNLSYRSVALRVWYLTQDDGSGNDVLVDDHNCTRLQANHIDCQELYADQYVGTDTQCVTECTSAAWNSINNCYSCLRTIYGRKVCSRDNFAIRPEAFKVEILDSNESDNIDNPSNLLPTTVAGSPAHAIAGYYYRFDINATNHVDNTATPRYIQHFEPGSATHGSRMRWFPNEVTPSSGACNDVDDKNITINLFDGTDVNDYNRTSYIDKVSQIGEYRFEIFDENWTSADWNDPEMLHHSGSYSSHYAPDTDCVVNDSTVLPSAVSSGRNGCKTSSVHTNPDTSEVYTYHYARYYPYTFNVDALNKRIGLSGTNPLYINTPGPNDRNMTYNIQGTFGAAGKDNNITSNFVTNCYAEDVNMSLYQHYWHPQPVTEPFLSYDLIDFNSTDSSVIYRPRSQGGFAVTNIDTTATLLPLTIDQGEEFFVKEMNGTITMDLGYDFNRTYNTPLNPRLVRMVDFNITFAANPTNLYVDLNTNHQIVGQKSLDENVTFVYARAKPSQYFYDDVTTNNINTPVSVVLYCDLGLIECRTRDINTTGSQTSEFDWYRSIDHNATADDGNITLGASVGVGSVSNPDNGTADPADVAIVSNGINNNINVAATVTTRPQDVNISFDAATNDWMIYNEDNDSIPFPFYHVHFVSFDSDWAGHGDTGHVVDSNTSYQKNRRLGW